MGSMQFVIPEGATAGATLSIPVPVDGVPPVMYKVPEDRNPGETVELQYEMPSSNDAESKSESTEVASTSINVSTSSGTNKNKKPELPTFWGYLSALTVKTIQFQRTRVLQTCCIVCMPVILMLLLLLLGLLFDSVKLQIVCGEDVSKDDCLEKGFNMTCVKRILENSGRPLVQEIVAGEASWGSINPNCGTDKGEDDGERAFICYDDLEKIKFYDIPFTAAKDGLDGIGKQSNKRNVQLEDWYKGFRYTLQSSRCQAVYDAKFKYENYCDGDKTPACQERLRDLIRTRTWKLKKDAEDAGDPAPRAGGLAGLLDTCLPDSTRRRRLQSTWEPSAAQLAEYQSYVGAKIACDSAWLLIASDRLRASPLSTKNVDSLITSEREGVLGKFSSRDYTAKGMSELKLSVLNAVWKNFSIMTEGTCLAVGSSEPSLTDLCNSSIAPTPNIQDRNIPQKPLRDFYFNSSCNQCVGGIIRRLAQSLVVKSPLYKGSVRDALTLSNIGLLAYEGIDPSFFDSANSRNPLAKDFNKWSTSYCRLLGIQDKFASGALFQDGIWSREDAAKRLYMPEDKKLWMAAWPPIYRAFMHGFDSTSTSKGRKAWESFCALDANLDEVRGVTFVDEKSTDGVNSALLDDWYGDNVNTDYMKSVSNRTLEGYRHHYYDVNMMAFDFGQSDVNTGQFDLIAYFNNSATEGGQRGVVDASKTHNGNWIPITNMIVNAIFGMLVEGKTRSDAMVQEFPSKFVCNRDEWLEGKAELDCPGLIPAQLQSSPLDSILDVFFPIILMLMIYPTVTSIVYEKQERLLIIMKMQGLPAPVYYIVTYVVHYVMYITIVLLMWIVGSLANVGIFSLHDQGVMWLLLIIWGHLCIAFAFFLSTFFSTMRAAMAVTFLAILILWIVGGSVFGQFFDNYENTTEISYTIMGLLPPWVMARWAKWVISMAIQGTPINAENWTTLGNGVLPTTMWVMTLEWFIYMGLYWYLENILNVGHGTPKGWCFCLARLHNDTSEGTETSTRDEIDDVPQVVHEQSKNGKWSRPHDVQAEHDRCVDLSNKGKPGAPRVRICNMHKIYPAIGGAPEKLAVKSVSFGVNEKECFGLLGHNGAGKTTLLNILTGLFPATSGTAFVDEFRLDKDMEKIYSVMGVCPQHDILWESLTGRQHVEFFGRLKGYRGDSLAKMVDAVTKSVNLTYAEKRKAGGYSGGMKRRLSVANSIVGGPEIVYMDEPSTGLDPASKHQLWDVISESRAGKSMILTTHSMEEADVLCDRLAIMAGGELQCIGRSWQLKRRFGKGYTLGITTRDKSSECASKIEEYVKGVFPSASLIDDPIGGVSKFEIGRDDVVLSDVFMKLNSDMEEYGIVDWGLTETTLEEVFLKLAALAELFEDKKFRGEAKSLSALDADVSDDQALKKSVEGKDALSEGVEEIADSKAE